MRREKPDLRSDHCRPLLSFPRKRESSSTLTYGFPLSNALKNPRSTGRECRTGEIASAQEAAPRNDPQVRSPQNRANSRGNWSNRIQLIPIPAPLKAMAAAATGNIPRARTLAAMARELDPKDGLVAFSSTCALSWGPVEEETMTLLEEALALPRSPSRIEASFDPHFKSGLSA